jgi:hypothetical protein
MGGIIKKEPANAGSPSPEKKVKKAKKKNYYFTEETEEKLIEYLKEEDQHIKNRIFDRYLHYPFYKMAENLIHTFKFYYTDGLEDLEDLKHELVIFFHGKLDKFNPDNGKAFSYYSLAGKRWLINYNNKNYKKLINRTIPEEIDNQYSILIEDEVESNRSDALAYFHYFVEDFEKDIDKIYKKDIEKNVAEALVMIFKRRNNPNMIFKKKALWIYIREITKLSNEDTPIITRVVKKAEKYYIKNWEKYLKTL